MNSKGHSVSKLQVLVLCERRSIRNTVFSMDKIPSSGEYAKVHAHEKIRVGEWADLRREFVRNELQAEI